MLYPVLCDVINLLFLLCEMRPDVYVRPCYTSANLGNGTDDTNKIYSQWPDEYRKCKTEKMCASFFGVIVLGVIACPMRM